MGTSVEIDVLRQVTNRILDYIERDLGMKAVDVPLGLYWEVPDEQLYNMESQPKQLDVGDLLDDIEFVTSACKDPSQSRPLVLMHVAPLLKVLSTAVPSYK